MSYAKWINQEHGGNSVEVDYVELSLQRDSARVVNELDQVLGSRRKKNAKTVSAQQNTDETLYKRPNGTISRSAMLKKISRRSRAGSLGEVCMDKTCPYNKWLYEREAFPSNDSLQSWERGLQPRLIPPPEVPKRVSSRTRSPESGFRSPSFSYFRPTDSPVTSTPPVPWTVYSSSPVSSSYPIITLPRSLRKSEKRRSSILSGVFSKSRELEISQSVIKTRPPSSSSSRSSSCSTCSSCSCTTSEGSESLNNTHNPVVSTHSKNPFQTPVGRKSPLTPPCDFTCYIITAFTVLCLAGVMAAFLYVYITNIGQEEEMRGTGSQDQ